ncbi:hypothetical protein EOD41_16600 [Mucilaginibacter limnophilus]|uniref:HTH marR-type domain-containing protein n=1 Tax=Mucilaginibacter limnophilus TaxID=1932778 RepID=A0A3S2Y1J4_9SPHI|nr:hypothetical protein [Mucilaginibacter limnophilus]RVT98412.1 hypothetical protein EOD41_16600 [Mucilaginibacter limnophilus]
MDIIKDISLQLTAANAALHRHFKSAFSQYDLAEHYLIMLTLFRMDGTTTPSELLKYVTASLPDLMSSLSDLKTAGYIELAQVYNDRDEQTIYLTGKAEVIERSLNAAVKEIAQAAFAGIDEDEQFNLWINLVRLNHNLSPSREY